MEPRKVFKDSSEGISPFRKQMLWSFASAYGIINEQAIEILVYTVTHLHNKCVDDQSLGKDIRPLIRSFFQCFPILDKVDVRVWIGMNQKVEEIKPSFYDEVMDRANKQGLQIAVSIAEIDQARKLGLN